MERLEKKEKKKKRKKKKKKDGKKKRDDTSDDDVQRGYVPSETLLMQMAMAQAQKQSVPMPTEYVFNFSTPLRKSVSSMSNFSYLISTTLLPHAHAR